MHFVNPLRLLPLSLTLASLLSSVPAHAVRVNSDGTGQALIYPYYNVRSTPGSNAFATLVTVVNVTSSPKALKVRFLESKAGAEILDFNLFLAAYDVWTAGIVSSGSGAGIFSRDNSCVVPALSRDGTSPTQFRNSAYVGDMLDDGLDRTKEGYFEILEMGTVDPQSELGQSITPAFNFSAPNASKPNCVHVPVTNDLPAGLSRPTGGLHGSVSLINVNEGTDYTVDATALSQWSDKPQWSIPGSAHPNLADASPAVSMVVSAGESGDSIYLTQWAQGRDAVSALFMSDQIFNDYTVEPNIKAATDWVLSLPTKRFYTSPSQSEAPFAGANLSGLANTSFCEVKRALDCSTLDPITYFDRETGWVGFPVFCPPFPVSGAHLCGVTSTITFSANASHSTEGQIFRSPLVDNVALNAGWINGHATYDVQVLGPNKEFVSTRSRGLESPARVHDDHRYSDGVTQPGKTIKFYGLPILGFAAQSYANGLLQGPSGSVLSNYGGTFGHKFRRRIVVVQ